MGSADQDGWGSAGAIYLSAGAVRSGSNLVTAPEGRGGGNTSQRGDAGGAGGTGAVDRITVGRATSIEGSTTPVFAEVTVGD